MASSELDALKCENQRLKEQNKTLIDMLSTLKQMKEMFAIMDHTFNDLSYKIDEIMLQNSAISSNDIADIDISFDASLVKDEKRTTDHTIIVHQIINAANNNNNSNNNNIINNISGNNHNNSDTITEDNGNNNNNTSYDSNNGAVMLVNATQPQFINLYDSSNAITDKHTKLALVVNSKQQRNRNFFTGKSTKARRKRLAKTSKLKSSQQQCNDKAVSKQQSDSNKPYVCHWAECQYSTAIKAHFKVHLRKHTGEKPYRCDHQNCDYTAASSSQVSRHRRIHLRSAGDYFNT